MFDVPDEVSKRWVPIAAERGAIVVDKSGAFRMEPDVPLVVPEVNPEAVRERPRGIISTPNCTTLSMMAAMGALHAEYGLSALVVASYQAVSGSGVAGTERLYAEIEAVAGDRTLGQTAGDVRKAVHNRLGDAESPFPAPMALQRRAVGGFAEGRRLGLGGAQAPQRVPQDPRHPRPEGLRHLRARPGDHDALAGRARDVRARRRRSRARGRSWRRPRRSSSWTTRRTPSSRRPPTSVGTDPTYVGRIRQAIDFPNTLDLFVCGDNLRKGAALNAAEIAELVAAEFTG